MHWGLHFCTTWHQLIFHQISCQFKRQRQSLALMVQLDIVRHTLLCENKFSNRRIALLRKLVRVQLQVCNGNWILHHSRSPTQVSCTNLDLFTTEPSFLDKFTGTSTLVNLVAWDQKTWRFVMSHVEAMVNSVIRDQLNSSVLLCSSAQSHFNGHPKSFVRDDVIMLAPKGRRSSFLFRKRSIRKRKSIEESCRSQWVGAGAAAHESILEAFRSRYSLYHLYKAAPSDPDLSSTTSSSANSQT